MAPRKPLTPRTEKNYGYYIERWRAAECPEPETWLDTLSPASAKQARNALRRLDPSLELRYRPEPKRVPRALTIAEVDRCRLACDNPLTRATFDGLYYSACRVEEFLRIQPGDIHNGMLFIRETKVGDRERVVPLHPRFPTWHLPHPWSVNWTLKRLNFVGQVAGIHLYPRLLRSTAATHMAAAGVPLHVLQEILGHANISTTRIYLAVTSDAKREAISALG